ncbi:hypothetical protein ACFYXH_38710 [Streptomyces sp. NPDC002730]|uniref:hypothetical protein n=1 Tax=Streptomyces sp. NPDC002730 TaxID=3364662 RepID=UPI003679D038
MGPLPEGLVVLQLVASRGQAGLDDEHQRWTTGLLLRVRLPLVQKLATQHVVGGVDERFAVPLQIQEPASAASAEVVSIGPLQILTVAEEPNG